jgi:DNA ligase-associated metallophosphoesterase
MLQVDCGGLQLGLLHERAVWWPQQQVLLIADAHLGKAQSFRRLGVPVPQGTTPAALERLDRLLAATGAGHIVFLGDLVHSAQVHASATVEAVAAWRARRPALRLTLVRGNHDRAAGELPPDWHIEVLDGPLQFGGLRLVHEPEAQTAPRPQDGGGVAYTLAGHLHPGVVVPGRAHQRLRLPCFHFGPQAGVLPAFGEFTGLSVQPRRMGDRLFAVAPDRVWEVPG